MPSFLSYFTSPTLYAMFHNNYQENFLTGFGNKGVSIIRGVYYVFTSMAFAPIILSYMYSKGYLYPQTILVLIKVAAYSIVFSFGCRFVGRIMDPEYRSFVSVYEKARIGTTEDQEQLKKYDFHIAEVRPDFVAKKNPDSFYLPTHPDANIVTEALAYYAIHAFGRQMLYPGSLSFLNWMLSGNLNNARKLLVNGKNGKRAWLKTTEGDLIDAIYVPAASGASEERKRTLILCSEGNAGFYEIGVGNTPVSLGYPVLAWNMPGFSESTGLPWPKNTLAGAEAVMQYARTVLNWPVENIVLFGWSIGGYPTSFLAANYPNVRGVVLDATFDDVLPLAYERMPSVVAPIVKHAIREHFNLHISKFMEKYQGPLKLVRRLQEEILTTSVEVDEHTKRFNNCINLLLIDILKKRHPELVNDMEPQVQMWLRKSPTERLHVINRDTEFDDKRRRLFAACDYYLTDFDANHVTPLDPGFFNVPLPVPNF